MGDSSKLHRLQPMTAALVGVLFFFAIIGVFGLRLAIAGLAVFVLGAVVVYAAFPTQGAES
jgi:energy-coupling factor transporter transmembrane protein EcfT